MGQYQYVGFGQSGNGPYLFTYQVNGTGQNGWVSLNMTNILPSGFSQAQSVLGNQSGSTAQYQNNYTTNQSQSNYTANGGIASSLMACQNQTYLTALPANLSSISSLSPIGNLNPPGHVIPSDHGSINLVSASTLQATVYAPGNVHILQIVYQNSTQAGKHFSDYGVYFSPCKQLVFYYGHLDELSGALQQQISNASKNASCQSFQEPGLASKTCTYHFDYMAKAGEVLGAAGGPNSNIKGFDFGGYDLRTSTQAFIDQARQVNNFGRPLNAICPVNYYTGALYTELYSIMNNTAKGSNGYPSCGTDMEDIAGTIQGNWYLNGSAATGPANSSQQMAIVHYYENPAIGVVSIGGVVAQASLNYFTPTSSGYINREPSQVTADGHIYCYYQNNDNTPYGASPLTGYFLVQLVNTNTLKIEYQNGACPQTPSSFSNPTIYVR
ncbi:MAG: hypothetical protein KGI06_01695 [Candidatus Micrarchaeota archaeon]|nr:hypothetical protein [Candidatus Micrarchaeota archaeon]